jgi:hypothetical protein
MEQVDLSFVIFNYSFWLLVGIFKVDRKDTQNGFPSLYQIRIDGNWLWADALVLRAIVRDKRI